MQRKEGATRLSHNMIYTRVCCLLQHAEAPINIDSVSLQKSTRVDEGRKCCILPAIQITKAQTLVGRRDTSRDPGSELTINTRSKAMIITGIEK